MPTNAVNLDALIPREDFAVIESSEWQKRDSINIRDLENTSFFYDALRKPDFQRETASWSPDKITDFVKTFLDGDLIPAIILWRSGNGSMFVIDGAHRLSALIAWVQNDYGAGKSSREFFKNHIPPEQLAAAKKTEDLIKKRVGTYAEHLVAVAHPENSSAAIASQAKRLASLGLALQWVGGDEKKAESSFFKINQEATAIDKTELRILKARTRPNALAARVIVRSATGHPYWSKFDEAHVGHIERIGRDIYNNLFTPALSLPLKTLDIPIAGRGYSAQALPLIFELVNLANNVKVVDPTKRNLSPKDPDPDESGDATVQFLKNTRRVVQRISGLHPSSLGLHPAVYFYSSLGRYQPTSFLAVVSLVRELEKSETFNDFTRVRRVFEDFLLSNKTISIDVTGKWGSGVKSFERLKDLYQIVLRALYAGGSAVDASRAIRDDGRFEFLSLDMEGVPSYWHQDFSGEAKSAVFLRQALQSPLRCQICHGLIHFSSITVDHVIRKQDGGLGVADNAQLAHPYCNTTFKN